MPIELGFWRLNGNQPVRLESAGLDLESRLEDILASDLDILNPGLLLIGRQVLTEFGKFIDLLALDTQGHVVVIELKRDKTPRDVVAQVLDYGSWVRNLKVEDLNDIFATFQEKQNSQKPAMSLDEAFCGRFGLKIMPEELNASHELVIVASELDPSTERIVTYLADQYGAQINAVFFRIFKDGTQEYLSRVWLRDPTEVEIKVEEKREAGAWNGEFYACFGDNFDWEAARKYGYIRAGGGSWYSRTLSLAEQGSRVWVNIPGQGYVGVAEIVGARKSQDDFTVQVDGKVTPIGNLLTDLSASGTHPDDQDYFVAVKWIKTVAKTEAVKEIGFFGNQNSLAKPRVPRWVATVARLKQRFNLFDSN